MAIKNKDILVIMNKHMLVYFPLCIKQILHAVPINGISYHYCHSHCPLPTGQRLRQAMGKLKQMNF